MCVAHLRSNLLTFYAGCVVERSETQKWLIGALSEPEKAELLLLLSCTTGPSPNALNCDPWTLFFEQVGYVAPSRETILDQVLPSVYHKYIVYVRSLCCSIQILHSV